MHDWPNTKRLLLPEHFSFWVFMVPSQMDSVQATKKRYKTDNAAIDNKNNLAEGTVRVFRFIASSTPIR